jgi:hypothetical protein
LKAQPLESSRSPPFERSLTLAFLRRLKPKAGSLPPDVTYFSAVDTPDVWLAYPWECDGDVEEHDAARVNNIKP